MVCEIFDFSQWSTGLLVSRVVDVLHGFVTAADVGAALYGVSNAMSYGDCYVVCAGLLSACDDHAARVPSFAKWLVERAPELTQLYADATPFTFHAGVCTGGLVGGVAGSGALRYFVFGTAMQRALTDLARCPSGAVVVDGHCAWTSVDVPVGEDGTAACTVQSNPAPPTASAATLLSGCTLRFVFGADRHAFDAFSVAEDADSRAVVAALPAAIAALYLISALVEAASAAAMPPLLPTGLLAAATVVLSAP